MGDAVEERGVLVKTGEGVSDGVGMIVIEGLGETVELEVAGELDGVD